MLSDYEEMVDNLIEAMGTMTNSIKDTLEFDKTIIATIENSSKADIGEYVVNYGERTFKAYSDNTKYRSGQEVYISIPNNDWSQRKIIVGKYSDGDDDAYLTLKDKIAPVSDNLLTFEDGFESEGILANIQSVQEELGKEKKGFVEIFNSDVEEGKENPFITTFREIMNYGCNKLLFSADFQTSLNNLGIEHGEFGLMLLISGVDVTTYKDANEAKKTFVFSLKNSDFFGNPYNIPIFTQQSTIIDISNIIDVSSIKIFLYESNNFQAGNKAGVDIYNLPSKEKQTEREIVLNNLEANIKNIFVKNINLQLCQDISDYAENEKLSLIPLNGITYSAIDNTNVSDKKIKLNWYKRNDNGRVENLNIANMPNTCVHWYRYHASEQVNDPIAGLFWVELDIKADENGILSYPPNINLQFDKIKVIIEKNLPDKDTTYLTLQQKIDSAESTEDQKTAYLTAQSNITFIESNEIQLINEGTVPDWEAYDLIRGLNLKVDEENNGGFYHLYNDDDTIISDYQAIKERKVEAIFTPYIVNIKEIDVTPTITWKIPRNNTMIKVSPDELRLKGFEEDLNAEDKEEYFSFYKLCPSSDPESNIFYYKIKKDYNINANNTIQCILTKLGKQYTTSATLVFGKVGTNGTDYTFTLETENNKNWIEYSSEDYVDIKPVLIDREGKEAQIDPTKIRFNNSAIFNIDKLSDKFIWRVKFQESKITSNGFSNIKPELITFSYEVSSNLKLSYTLLIGIYQTSIDQLSYEGPGRVVYNKNGVDAKYYKDVISLYVAESENSSLLKKDGLIWEVYKNGQPFNNEAIKTQDLFVEKNKNNDNYHLIAPTVFYKDFYDTDKNIYYLVAKKGSEEIFKMPLYIYQEKYTSDILNRWNNDLTIDEENGIILSSMMGAGKKNEFNEFSGVVFGDLEQVYSNNTKKTNTGIYGFSDGIQSFGFKDDGTAFIGKPGQGQIVIDGTNSYISNAGYVVTDLNTSGIKIDFDKGRIDGNLTNHGGFTLSATDNSQVGFFSIYKRQANEDQKFLIMIGGGENHDEYYLQTANFQEHEDSSFIGTKLNLNTGHFQISNSLGGDITKYITLNTGAGNDEPPFKIGSKFSVSWDGSITSTGGTIGSWNIDTNTISALEEKNGILNGAILISPSENDALYREVNNSAQKVADNVRIAIGQFFNKDNKRYQNIQSQNIKEMLGITIIDTDSPNNEAAIENSGLYITESGLINAACIQINYSFLDTAYINQLYLKVDKEDLDNSDLDDNGKYYKKIGLTDLTLSIPVGSHIVNKTARGQFVTRVNYEDSPLIGKYVKSIDLTKTATVLTSDSSSSLKYETKTFKILGFEGKTTELGELEAETTESNP